MDLKQIKELMTAMEKAGMKKLTIKEKTGFELQLETQDAFPPAAQQAFGHHPVFIPHPQHAPKPHDPLHSHPHTSDSDDGSKAKSSQKAEGKFITSPMVGTFYPAPSPEDAPFVKVGDRVEEGSVVCIIEAMKVMNEVKAGTSGTLAESYLDSGNPVEFGTKLFRIV